MTATKSGQDAGVQARCVAPSPALGRPSGADHEEQPPELIGLDATRSWRCRGPFCPRSRPDFSPRRMPALKPLFSRAVRTVAWNAVRGCGCRSPTARRATPGRMPGRHGHARAGRSRLVAADNTPPHPLTPPTLSPAPNSEHLDPVSRARSPQGSARTRRSSPSGPALPHLGPRA